MNKKVISILLLAAGIIICIWLLQKLNSSISLSANNQLSQNGTDSSPTFETENRNEK